MNPVHRRNHEKSDTQPGDEKDKDTLENQRYGTICIERKDNARRKCGYQGRGE